ncbi:hypothetical protein KUTeg_000469 [Tegillarca granosa]|uniref:Uncharacterized protein n=1 Tax=Tegillarca granosa TaxID=220873 RepID=A0ABQ9FXM0_TEGGR|nr:hypothetical protein KUTeg_000469 [Tegillarca granosa]
MTIDELKNSRLCVIQTNIMNGRRQSTSTAFLKPAIGRRNVFVITEALVSKILIHKKKAYGIRYLKYGRTYTVRARREVIISGGTFESAKLLQLSGIGSKKVLQKLNVRPNVFLQVGENFQDHILMLVDIKANVPRNFFKSSGLWANNGALLNMFIDFVKQKHKWTEIQFFIYNNLIEETPSSSDVQAGRFPERKPSYLKPRKETTLGIFLSHPKSRGVVIARSIRYVQKIFRDSSVMRKVGSRLITRPPVAFGQESVEQCYTSTKIDSDEFWKCVLRQQFASEFKKIKGLRVVDAPVLPEVSSGNPIGPAIMIRERAADFIKKCKQARELLKDNWYYKKLYKIGLWHRRSSSCRCFGNARIGSGAGGATVAARLSEVPEVTVCLFEAGVKDTQGPHASVVQIPRLWSGLYPGDYTWNTTTVPQQNLNGRVGGSTSHNAMIFFRGFKADYDHWEEIGAKGWNYKNVLPYFLKSENMTIDELKESPHPKSKGTIKARSNNPADTPLIDPQYLSHKDDLEILLKGIRFLQLQLKNSAAMRKVGARLVPRIGWFNQESGKECYTTTKEDSDEFWTCVIRQQLSVGLHPVRSCPIGASKDRRAVVDPHLRVYGIEGLRVVDASVMPEISSGNTMAPTIMIGEYAADIIKRDQGLEKHYRGK